MRGHHWRLWGICLLTLNVHLTLSSNCDWNHFTAKYDKSCQTTTVKCANITSSHLDGFHNRQVSEDCSSNRCYGIDIEDSNIYYIDETTILGKLACKIYEVTLINAHIHTVENKTFAKYPNLWSMNLSRNDITTTGFLEGTFNNLHVLNMSFNKLDQIVQTTFKDLTQLEQLYLGNNLIKSIDDESFKNLGNLKILHMNNNNLLSISKYTLTGMPKLNYLYLQQNRINSIAPGAFSNLDSLVTMDLTGNNVDTLQKDIFIGLGHLESLNLTGLNIRNLEVGAFNSMGSLSNLDLHGNKLETIPAKVFFDLQRAKILNLSNNSISALNVDSFSGLVNLRRLVLNDNSITDIPVGTFESCPLLENLQLGNNSLSRLGLESFFHLGELKYLNLSHNKFSELNDVVLAPLRSLTSLKLDHNKLSRIDYKMLLLQHPNLGFLSIHDNNWNCAVLTEMLVALKSKKVEYSFTAITPPAGESVQGISCTNLPVEVSEEETIKPGNSTATLEMYSAFPSEMKTIIEDLTNSMKNFTGLLADMKKDVNVLSENSVRHEANHNQSLIHLNLQKDVSEVLDTMILKNRKLGEIKDDVNTLSRNVNDYMKSSEDNLAKLSEIIKEDETKYISQKQFFELVGNLSKSESYTSTGGTDYGLYVISALIFTLLIVIIALLLIKMFQTRRFGGSNHSRSEIELLNGSC